MTVLLNRFVRSPLAWFVLRYRWTSLPRSKELVPQLTWTSSQRAGRLMTIRMHWMLSSGTNALQVSGFTESHPRTTARKQSQSNLAVDPELSRLLAEARTKEVSEEDLHEQRISFAFGDAPESSYITKESVRLASQHIRLKP